MRRTPKAGDSTACRTDWSRATRPMPASFADQPRRDAAVESRRNDDGLDLVEALAGAATLAAIAELAPGEPSEDAVGVSEPDMVATRSEDEAEPDEEDSDEED